MHYTGLIISVNNPWLEASPDDKVYDPNATQSLGISEYKNPYAARNFTLHEACDTVKSFCLERREEKEQVTYKLKRRHDYYYQIQCQMFCSKVEWCDFVVRTSKDLHVQCIFRDPNWWKQQMPRLNEFYFDALLPCWLAQDMARVGSKSHQQHPTIIMPSTCETHYMYLYTQSSLSLSLTQICHHYYTYRTQHTSLCTLVHVVHNIHVSVI